MQLKELYSRLVLDILQFVRLELSRPTFCRY